MEQRHTPRHLWIYHGGDAGELSLDPDPNPNPDPDPNPNLLPLHGRPVHGALTLTPTLTPTLTLTLTRRTSCGGSRTWPEARRLSAPTLTGGKSTRRGTVTEGYRLDASAE